METTRKHGIELHKEYLEWIAKFEFYEEEMANFKTKLADILNKYTANDVEAGAHQLLNKVDIQRANLQKVKDYLRRAETLFAADVKEKPEQYKHIFTDEDIKNRDDIEYFQKMYPELKAEMQQFLAKYL